MEVILKKDVKGLGKAGEKVKGVIICLILK